MSGLKLPLAIAIIACGCGGAAAPAASPASGDSAESLRKLVSNAASIDVSRSEGGAEPRRKGTIAEPARVQEVLAAIGIDQPAPKSACLRCPPDLALTIKDASAATLGVVELFCSGDSQAIYRVGGSADCRAIVPADAAKVSELAKSAAP